jgi:hypothetical protein
VRHPQRARYAIAAASVAIVALGLYVPTLLGDVGTWDTAEFQAIGPVLGIAHPTGYPTYTLTAWLASVLLQPFGNEAYRADLLSALLMAGAAALLAVRVVQATRRLPLGLFAGLAFAVTPVAWRVATRADAHALHVFLAALILVLLAAWQWRQRDGQPAAGRWLVAAGVVYGLALGNHALTLLLAPGIAVYVLAVSPRILWRQWRLVLAGMAVVLLTTVVVYTYLPLRSAMDPPLDYASPDTWSSFWYVVLGEQFQGSFRALPSLVDMTASIWDDLVRGYGPLAILALAGVILGSVRQPRLILLTALWFGCSWVFALGYPNASIERYYLVPLLAAALWMALAADAIWDVLRESLLWPGRTLAYRVAVGALLAASLLAVLAPVPERYDRVDASGQHHGREWLEAAFAALEPEAAVVSWWSYSTPLWYGRWVEGRRDDIVIVDDRDVLDDGFRRAENAIDHFLRDRPTYIIRLDRDLPALRERYVLERVESVPGPGHLYRVLGPRSEE